MLLLDIYVLWAHLWFHINEFIINIYHEICMIKTLFKLLTYFTIYGLVKEGGIKMILRSGQSNVLVAL
jgi:hypothetical protein